MKKYLFILMAVFALACILNAATNFPSMESKLKAGSKAPNLTASKWIKGKPINKFQKGSVYVVEFWSTWCPPCRESIPELTKLAKKYKGKITFIGVNVWDSSESANLDEYAKKVSAFVEKQGSNMDYNICLDDMKGTVADKWMGKGEGVGIPTAFIINKNGMVAKVCSPFQLEQIIPSLNLFPKVKDTKKPPKK